MHDHLSLHPRDKHKNPGEEHWALVLRLLAAAAAVYLNTATRMLSFASSFGHAQIVSEALSHGAIVTMKPCQMLSVYCCYSDGGALINAARYGHTEVVSLLLAANADVYIKESGALSWAARNDDDVIADMIINAAGVQDECPHTVAYKAMKADLRSVPRWLYQGQAPNHTLPETHIDTILTSTAVYK